MKKCYKNGLHHNSDKLEKNAKRYLHHAEIDNADMCQRYYDMVGSASAIQQASSRMVDPTFDLNPVIVLGRSGHLRGETEPPSCLVPIVWTKHLAIVFRPNWEKVNPRDEGKREVDNI